VEGAVTVITVDVSLRKLLQDPDRCRLTLLLISRQDDHGRPSTGERSSSRAPNTRGRPRDQADLALMIVSAEDQLALGDCGWL
jgi:hypothetical protein